MQSLDWPWPETTTIESGKCDYGDCTVAFISDKTESNHNIGRFLQIVSFLA